MYILFLYIYIHIIYIYIYLYIDISHVDFSALHFHRLSLLAVCCAVARPGVTWPPAPRFTLLSCAALPEAVEDCGVFVFGDQV